ncbi:MAG: ArnT family glycosyltransferase [Candidatus Dormibacterales bacterium]
MEAAAERPHRSRLTVALAAVAPFLALAAAKVAVHLATNGAYGFHRDALYYLASARHLALGYVDYPPITPLLARLSLALFGASAWGLRLWPTLAGTATLLLSVLLARELGGGRQAQVLTGLAMLASPLFLGSNWLFQTVTFDQLAWTVCFLVLARLAQGGGGPLWLALGAALGIGIETKYTILALALGIAVAAMASARLRTDLRTPWPWLGALAALVIWAPNLVWQMQHGWPSLAYVFNHRAAQSTDFSVSKFLSDQIAIVGPAAIPFWLLGWFGLMRQGARRPVGVAALVAFVIFALSGKGYYAGPVYPPLLAAAAVTLCELTARRLRGLRVAAAAVLLVEGAVLLPLALPVVPERVMVHTFLAGARTDFADTVGWPDLAHQVASVYDGLGAERPRGAAILASNYGEAGAIDLYGPALGLPPALSPELSYYYWKPAHVAATTYVVVGLPAAQLRGLFASVKKAGVVTNSFGLHNPEWGAEIFVCRDPVIPIDRAWPTLKNLS